MGIIPSKLGYTQNYIFVGNYSYIHTASLIRWVKQEHVIQIATRLMAETVLVEQTTPTPIDLLNN